MIINTKRVLGVLFFLAACVATTHAKAQGESSRRLVIAHHMNAELPYKAGGMYARGIGSNTPTPPRIHPKRDWSEIGGRLRDMSITTLSESWVGYGVENLTPREQAAWEIAVAQRAGVDAFAFYGALPGNTEGVLAYMRAAQGSGFKITLCQSVRERSDRYEEAMAAMRRLVEADRELDTLLRIDGKLLMLSYGRGGWGFPDVEAMIAKRHDIERQVGTPMLILYMPRAMTTTGHIRDVPERVAAIYEDQREHLGRLLEGGFDGFSPFMVTGCERSEADQRFFGELCRIHGKMFFPSINFQFHSALYMTHAPVADANWRRAWDLAHESESTAGVQVMTWNDWGETSALAPGVGANYGLYDMLRVESAALKAGRAPAIEQDEAWVMYYRYPSDSQTRLFHAPSERKYRGPEHDHIWVRTRLVAPATVVCEGRGEREVPAGDALVSFPLTPGSVRISIHRDGTEVLTLSPPEAVTDQPWRPDHSLVAFASDQKERAYREQDFPGQAPRYYSEYGDDDGDGLLNWFEGLYFSTLERPATPVGPGDNFNGISLARAQREFREPIMPPPHYPVGFVWSTRALPTFSKTRVEDDQGIAVWEFGYTAPESDTVLPSRRDSQSTQMWALRYPDGAQHTMRHDGRLEIALSPEATPVLRWTSPVAGRIHVQAEFEGNSAGSEGLFARLTSDEGGPLDGRQMIDKNGNVRFDHLLDVKPGDKLRFFCESDDPARLRRNTSVQLDLNIELIESRMPIPEGDAVDPPVIVDLERFEENLASAIWRSRYRWGEAGLRRESDGLAIFNPGDHATRDMFAFVDTLANHRYGPLCRWGDVGVTADIRFAYGDRPPGAWGSPAFAVTTRIAPKRRTLYFLRIEVPSRQEDPAKPTAALRLGWMLRAHGETAREEVFAETAVPLSARGDFRLSLAAHTVGDDTVRLSGVCQWPDGTHRRLLTAERALRVDGTTPWGEVGFEARLSAFADTPETPNHVLLRSFSIHDPSIPPFETTNGDHP